MKHKVLKSFIDKETGLGYNAGSTFNSVDIERVSFLSELGYIEKPKEQVIKDAPKRKTRTKNQS